MLNVENYLCVIFLLFKLSVSAAKIIIKQTFSVTPTTVNYVTLGLGFFWSFFGTAFVLVVSKSKFKIFFAQQPPMD